MLTPDQKETLRVAVYRLMGGKGFSIRLSDFEFKEWRETSNNRLFVEIGIEWVTDKGIIDASLDYDHDFRNKVEKNGVRYWAPKLANTLTHYYYANAVSTR